MRGREKEVQEALQKATEVRRSKTDVSVYLYYKGEGDPVYDGADKNKVYWCCMNEKCKNFYKSIEEIKNNE